MTNEQTEKNYGEIILFRSFTERYKLRFLNESQTIKVLREEIKQRQAAYDNQTFQYGELLREIYQLELDAEKAKSRTPLSMVVFLSMVGGSILTHLIKYLLA